MLFRLFSLVLFLIIAALAASWLARQPGELRLEWLDWRVEIRTSLAIAILVMLAALLVFADRLWRRLLSLPGWFGSSLRHRRDAAGHRALTLGLMAVSAGEPGEAKRQATRAQRLLKSAPQLTDLLSAQAAHLAGDKRAAGRYFRSLTTSDDTAFLGYIGLARLAHEDDRPDDALAAARQALDLKPKSAMAAAQVLGLEAARGNWAAAAPALDVVIAAGDQANPADRARLQRQKTVIAYLQGKVTIDGDGGEAPSGKADIKRALRQLEGALAEDPGFWPGVLLVAGYYGDTGNKRKAGKLLEAGFRAMPHTALADMMRDLWGVNDGAYVAKLMKLVSGMQGEAADDAASIVAAAALDAGIDGEAKALLARIDDAEKDVTAWQLLARLAEMNEDAVGVAAALRSAGDAPRPRGWQCQSCHVMSNEWHSHCRNCDAFATLDWRRPDHVTPMAIAADVNPASGVAAMPAPTDTTDN